MTCRRPSPARPLLPLVGRPPCDGFAQLFKRGCIIHAPLFIPFEYLCKTDEERSVIGFITELEGAKYIKVQWHPADTNLIRCYFPQPAWVRPSDAKQRGTNKDNRRRADKPKAKPASRHSRDTRDTCIKYAFACMKAEGRIKTPYAFANPLYCTGAQDAEIDRFLATQQDEAHAA